MAHLVPREMEEFQMVDRDLIFRRHDKVQGFDRLSKIVQPDFGIPHSIRVYEHSLRRWEGCDPARGERGAGFDVALEDTIEGAGDRSRVNLPQRDQQLPQGADAFVASVSRDEVARLLRPRDVHSEPSSLASGTNASSPKSDTDRNKYIRSLVVALTHAVQPGSRYAYSFSVDEVKVAWSSENPCMALERNPSKSVFGWNGQVLRLDATSFRDRDGKFGAGGRVPSWSNRLKTARIRRRTFIAARPYCRST